MGRCTCRGPAAEGTFTSRSVKLNPSSRDQRVGTRRRNATRHTGAVAVGIGIGVAIAFGVGHELIQIPRPLA